MPREDRQRVVLPMNLLEELAQAYEDNLVDEKIVRKILAPASMAYHEEAGWFIEYMRSREPRAWEKWTRLNGLLSQPAHTWHGLGEKWVDDGGIWGNRA